VVVALQAGGEQSLEGFLSAFAAAHRREYGYELPGKPVEIVNCRLQAIGNVPKAPLTALTDRGSVQEALTARRSVYFGEQHGWIDTPVYLRDRIAAGTTLHGPAVVEEMSSTVVLAPGQRAEFDRIGNILVHVRGEA